MNLNCSHSVKNKATIKLLLYYVNLFRWKFAFPVKTI